MLYDNRAAPSQYKHAGCRHVEQFQPVAAGPTHVEHRAGEARRVDARVACHLQERLDKHRDFGRRLAFVAQRFEKSAFRLGACCGIGEPSYGANNLLAREFLMGRDGMEQVKAQEQDKKAPISQDEAKNWSEEVQKLTDQHIKLIDAALADKEKDIRQV